MSSHDGAIGLEVAPSRGVGVASRTVPDDPASKPPYRTPWEAATRATHPERFKNADELQQHIKNLRREVDAGLHDQRQAPELADTIAALTDGREWLRRRVRPRRAAYFYTATLLASWGAFAYFSALPNAQWLLVMLAGVAIAAALNVARLAQWADILPEYDGLIADLRKLAEARRKEGVGVAGTSKVTPNFLRELREVLEARGIGNNPSDEVWKVVADAMLTTLAEQSAGRRSGAEAWLEATKVRAAPPSEHPADDVEPDQGQDPAARAKRGAKE